MGTYHPSFFPANAGAFLVPVTGLYRGRGPGGHPDGRVANIRRPTNEGIAGSIRHPGFGWAGIDGHSGDGDPGHSGVVDCSRGNGPYRYPAQRKRAPERVAEAKRLIGRSVGDAALRPRPLPRSGRGTGLLPVI